MTQNIPEWKPDQDKAFLNGFIKPRRTSVCFCDYKFGWYQIMAWFDCMLIIVGNVRDMLHAAPRFAYPIFAI